ncbi:MAG TPA: dihydrolipoyl dehydrogenase [Acidimicrobiales bacterium]
MPDKYDIVVIGGGPAGYGTALYAAAAGLSVAMVEKDRVGGTCLQRGCIPAKELLETAAVRRTVAHAAEFGVGGVDEPSVDVTQMMARKQQIIDGLTKGLSSVLSGRSVDVVDGFGRFDGKGAVTVTGGDGDTIGISGTHVVLAAGSVPRTIPGFEVDGKFVLTSDEVFGMKSLPARVAVIGGGAIGCEFASMLADLGSQVTVLEALPEILPGCDADAVSVVKRAFKKRKIDVRTGVKVTGHSPGDSTTVVAVEGSDPVEVEAVIVSVGRRACSDGLLADGTGVSVDDRGFVDVDEWCRTGVDGVWAAGDLIATPGLAHVGFAEAILIVKQILGETAVPVDYAKVPWCVYCHPEVAFAGLTEDAAKDAGYQVVVSKHQYRGNGRALIVGDTDGLVKVIAEDEGDGTGGRILGVHMAGPWVTEQLGQAYLAVNWEATVDEVAHFIQPHPTLSELFGETVLSLTGRGLHG